MFSLLANMDALYENSKPFEKFLAKQELDSILREVKLKLRAQHKIVPHVSGRTTCSEVMLPGAD